jgi:hypothetical protein
MSADWAGGLLWTAVSSTTLEHQLEIIMKKILLTSVAMSATLMGSSAFAFTYTPPTVDPRLCDSLCLEDRVDLKQALGGHQWAKNLIVDVNDAQDIVQNAVNAGNLINLEDLGQALGTISQNASVGQFAFNLITAEDNGYFDPDSVFYNIEQAATNVVNSVSADVAINVRQNVTNNQAAFNTILGGSGGYDADDVDFELDTDAIDTQTAVNASNLVDIREINNEIVQISTGSQTAINTAAFDSSGFGYFTEVPDVYDLAQSATNVTNNVTIAEFDVSGFCACEYEVDQYADVGQVAVNSLSALGDVQNIVQSATNVANSISMPSADE